MDTESAKCFEREFKYTGHDFSEMTNPSELGSAVGSLAMNFSTLEEEVSSAVICLMGCKAEDGLVVVSEMSFRAKLSVFSSLMRPKYKEEKFSFSKEEFEDLLYMCAKYEEMRNLVLHSSWVHDHAKKQVRRRKLSAKMKKGSDMRKNRLLHDRCLILLTTLFIRQCRLKNSSQTASQAMSHH